MAATIEVRDLSHTYSAGTPFQHDAVKHMSFSVEKGEFLGIIGHTGSGKSTLIQHLNGLPDVRRDPAGRDEHLAGQENNAGEPLPCRAGVPVSGVSAV